MKLVFITNYIHHHQIPLADEFYRLLGDDYKYIATDALPDWLIKGGYDPSISRPYVIRAYENEEKKQRAMRLANDADVVIIGSAPDSLVQQRLKNNKITFHYSERWFKDGYYHLLSLRALRNYWRYHTRYRSSRSYMLCASAFTASDVHKVFAYPDKCFKWGYFTKVEDFDFEASYASKQGNIAHLMWCARFLDWKHPELPIKMAYKLKSEGYEFTLDMFGSGKELEKTKSLSQSLGLDDVVLFRGNLPNAKILQEMCKHDIFLFTSDRNEGWGAVTNEAMSNGCTFVGSNAIGSVPFLVKDNDNGLIFKSGDINSLIGKVKYLLDNPAERKRLAQNAYHSMLDVWSPANAASRFIALYKALENGEPSPFSEGPCSVAK